MSTSTSDVVGPEQGYDWNVDDVRGDHESDEHWELRRNFLIKNKGQFEKLRLLSLSQVFANHEFLGCRYPEETMELVAECSVGIIEEYRKARANRLQRTFVKASDAAERKSKGTKRLSTSTPTSSSKSPKVFIRDSSTTLLAEPYRSLHPPVGSGGDVIAGVEKLEAALSRYGDDLRGLVLVDQIFQDREGPLQTINRSCGMSHKQLSVEYAMECCGAMTIKIGTSFVIEGRGYNRDSARQEASSRAVEALRHLCYTIEVKANVVSATEFGKTDISSNSCGEPDALSEDNVGNKLLRLMGWQEGKGLGKAEQGIQTPISASPSPEVVQRSRLGLGMSSQGADFANGVKEFLKRQMWQCSQFDLQFSPEFNSDERKIIHQVASQLQLRSRSHGKGDNRFLVVSRKVQLQQLLQELLTLGESAKHRVIPPGILSQPNNTGTTLSLTPTSGQS